MCQKWEGDCCLWVLNEIILKRYAESLKIVGAVWELNSTATPPLWTDLVKKFVGAVWELPAK